jgi:hypothetical protein
VSSILTYGTIRLTRAAGQTNARGRYLVSANLVALHKTADALRLTKLERFL